MKLEIQGVTCRFGSHAALDGLDLSVGEGVSCLCFIGPSGGGKSTLLRVLGGLAVPDEGTVAVDGETLPADERALLAHRRRNGFLFQAFNLFPHLTALENIALPLVEVHGIARQEARRRAEDCLDRFGLGDHCHKRPAELSGGQQQRIGIARAVACRPRLLILDEPTSALDPEMTAEVLDVIREIAEGGQDIILSTHEMGFARAVADRVVFLADGRVVEEGAPAAFFESPASEAARRFLSRVMKY